VFTSANAVDLWFEHLRERGLDARAFASTKLAAIGPATAEALAGRGIVADVVPEEYVAEAVVEVMRSAQGWGRDPQRVLVPRAEGARPELVEGLRAAGATVIFDDSILPDRFAGVIGGVYTRPYIREGTDTFLQRFGPAEYRSVAEYEKVVGSALPPIITGAAGQGAGAERQPGVTQRTLQADPDAEANYYAPRRRALDAYNEVFERLHLDGLVYPAAQMPPPDETMPQYGRLSGGPHSDTSWVNMIGVPAVVVPGGFYATGLPFGLEISARPWQAGDLLGYAYAYEQATKHRRPPVLVDRGLLRTTATQ